MWNKPKIGEDIWFQIPFDSLSFLRLSAFLSRQPLNRAHLKLWFFQFSFFKRINSCANIFTMNNVKTKRIWAVWNYIEAPMRMNQNIIYDDNDFILIPRLMSAFSCWKRFHFVFYDEQQLHSRKVGIKHYHQASWKCIFFHFRVSMVIQIKRKWRWHCCVNE